ncbi:MAG: radical SAM protein [Candidatus Alcyoniella australis]|nr:radical SAM protein [Candidatus Alcyoniella australis]
MNYIFGPVASRRLGYSLGIDIVPANTCSCDCLFCEVDRTSRKSVERSAFVHEERVIDELTEALALPMKVDIITFSGSGEPTLNSRLGQLIRRVKRVSELPVAVITNSTLIDRPDVRSELSAADIVLPSLHSVVPETFQRLCRPARGVSLESMIQGLATFRSSFAGQLWLEVLLVKGINDSPHELTRLRRVIDEIMPDRIQVATVTRPPADQGAQPVSRTYLENVCGLFGPSCELVGSFGRSGAAPVLGDERGRMLELLKRRAATLDEVIEALQIDRKLAKQLLTELVDSGAVQHRVFGDRDFYLSISD